MTAPRLHPRLLATGGLLAMASAIGIGRFIYTPILPTMAEDLHLTQGAAGLIASANFIGYLAGAVAATTPAFKRPRAVLLVMLGVSVATTAAMAASQSLPAFLALRFAGGVAAAYVLVVASSLVLDRLAVAGKGHLSAVHFAGVGAGITASALLTWGLAALGLGWRAMWLGGGAVALVGAAAVAALVPEAGATGSPGGDAGQTTTDPRLRPLAIAYGLFGFGYVITATFIVVIVRKSPSAAPIEPLFWLVLGVAAIPSVALWVAIGRRLGVVRAFAAACLVEAAGVFASVAWPGTAGLFIASVLLGGTFMGLTALGLIAARTFAPANPRRWLAILTAAFGIGQIAGPIVSGYGFDLTGSFFLPSMLAVVALCMSSALALAIERRGPA